MKVITDDSHALIARLAAGDRAALRDLYDRHGAALETLSDPAPGPDPERGRGCFRISASRYDAGMVHPRSPKEAVS